MNKILWNSIKSPLRYFWVPAGEDVFAGEYQIENGDGEEASVDLESIVPFEIDGDQAEEIMLGELENMTTELGDLFKGLFSLGKRMINAEIMDDDSEETDSDWDSEESDSDWDSESDSDEESDSEFDDADLEKVISLFDLDSDEDSDEDSESGPETLEDILSQFGEDVEGPLNELRDLLVKEFGNLGEELDKLGAQAAEQLDAEPGAGQDILRELGQWLINLADDRRDTDEDVVVMEFKPKDNNATNLVGSDDEGSVEDQEEKHESSSNEDSDSSSKENSLQTDSKEIDEEDIAKEENDSVMMDSETESDTNKTPEPDIEFPSSTALKRMTKAQLIELGSSFGMTLSMKDTKNTLLEQLETLR